MLQLIPHHHHHHHPTQYHHDYHHHHHHHLPTPYHDHRHDYHRWHQFHTYTNYHEAHLENVRLRLKGEAYQDVYFAASIEVHHPKCIRSATGKKS